MSPRCLGPSRPTPEGRGAAHGPRHPAYPLLLRHLILLWGFRLLFSRFLGSVWVFRSEAEILCLLLFALQDPTPVSFVVGVSLSLSLSCCLVVLLLAVVAFLFLSSSGAGETQTALRFVVPLVLTWPRSSSSTRTSTTAPTPRRAPAPAVFFFVLFCFRCRRRSLSLSLSLFSLSLYLFSVGRPCLQAYMREQTGVAYKTAPPIIITIVFFSFFLGKEHWTAPRTDRPELSVLPPLPSRSPLKQGPEEGMGEATVLSHKCVR